MALRIGFIGFKEEVFAMWAGLLLCFFGGMIVGPVYCLEMDALDFEGFFFFTEV